MRRLQNIFYVTRGADDETEALQRWSIVSEPSLDITAENVMSEIECSLFALKPTSLYRQCGRTDALADGP